MTNRTKWTEFTGADEQIAELTNKDIIYIDSFGYESGSICNFRSNLNIRELFHDRQITHYWIIPDDPLREMKIRQAQTGQPVWTRRKIENEYFYWLPTTTPDWNIPNAEYSFTPFEKEIESKEEV